ncbi:amino acid adenylation domain-containing protein [Mycobacterium attenuatum]|uniref:amino acid adenylation domain-containing protein n=1 Tax=Mycobacterium attenuatum TaxID=2341086 RepID=UPI000F013D79|nr:amino acid adenylation domain-containing protein [Mycobacterium attenuatum]VBA62410.1 Polyketide synthase PksN [Mycobacterium attenuatum]
MKSASGDFGITEEWIDDPALAGAVLITPDHARPPMQGFTRARIAHSTGHGSIAATPATGDLNAVAALSILLWRHSGGTDNVVLGTMANDHAGPPLPLQLSIDGVLTGEQLLAALISKTNRLNTRRAEYDYDEVSAKYAGGSSFDRNPLFQTAFASIPPAVDDMTAALDAACDSAISCDLIFIRTEIGAQVTLICDYDAVLFEAATVQWLVLQWDTLITSIDDNAALPVSRIRMSHADERAQIARWAHGPEVVRASTTIPALVAQQVARTPDQLAVEFGSESLTYTELSARAYRIAAYLVENGTGPRAIVATCLHRSIRLPAVYLGIMQSGNAFLPLDPNDPAHRHAEVVTDAGAVMVVCDSRSDADSFMNLPEITVLVLDDEWPIIERSEFAVPPPVEPADLAYVIYTSGSTGKPKGVLVEHASVCNRLQHNKLGLESTDTVLQKTPLTFDVSLWEIFAPLINGARLVIAEPDGHRDSRYLAALIREKAITTAHFVPSMLRLFLAEPNAAACVSLRRVTCSGEALTVDLARSFAELFPSIPLYNYYGPTEASIEVTFWECTTNSKTRTIPIGRPIDNVAVHVLDEHGDPSPIGVPGDLYIGGACLARGYRDSSMDAGRFVASAWEPVERLYASGDRARWSSNGTVEYLGRADRQVKVRGIRIEPGEVEKALLALPYVQEAAVTTGKLSNAGEDLIAYIVTADVGVDNATIRRELRSRLPAYMIPAAYVHIAALPQNTAGKIDYRKLPVPKLSSAPSTEPATTTTHTASSAVVIQHIWQAVLGHDRVGLSDNFFDLGGNSVLLAEVYQRLDAVFPGQLARTDLFRFPTIEALAGALCNVGSVSERAGQADCDTARSTGGFAIVGMACRVPGAENIDEFWNLIAGAERSIRELSDAELLSAGESPERIADPRYVRSAAVLQDIEYFDAELFGMSPREAEVTDPQHRLLLETAHQALDHAGYGSTKHRPRCGVFVGGLPSDYFHRYLAADFRHLPSAAHYQVKIGNEVDFLPTLLSYKLDLRGPAIAVQSACSTSLVAVHLATASLARGECDMAIAGGVSVRVPHYVGYLYEDGMVASPDGHCRAFDEAAAGTVFGSGSGVVVLKRFDDALRDGDHIFAVVRGSAINNDGSAKIGYTAPGVTGQVDVITRAQRQAGVRSADIAYVEAHGTGTPLGDPVEIDALQSVFGDRVEERAHCTIGSVKGNIGHLDAAAGVAGLIKTTLALHYGIRPGQPDLVEPSRRIPWASTPFQVSATPTPWPVDANFAGVSAFGIGGTNAHVVLERPPAPTPQPRLGRPGHGIFTLSARSPRALELLAGKIGDHLASTPGCDLTDVCFTLSAGRHHHPYRLAAVPESIDHLQAQLDAFAANRAERGLYRGPSAPASTAVCLVFPDHADTITLAFVEANMHLPVVREAITRCAHGTGDLAHTGDPRAWFASATSVQREFAAHTVLAALWDDLGLHPPIVLGIGTGQWAAAAYAGTLSIEEALGAAHAGDHPRLDKYRDNTSLAPTGPIQLLLGSGACRRAAQTGIEFAVILGGIGADNADLRADLTLAGIETTMSTEQDRGGSWAAIYRTAAKLYAAGFDLDLTRTGPMKSGRRIPLPASPLERQRHWIDRAMTSASQTSAQLPLPGQVVELPLSDEKRYEMTFARHQPAYVDHHRLFGHMVVPGASHVAMSIAAAAQLKTGPCVMEDILFLHPFTVSEAAQRRAQLVLRPDQSGAWALNLVVQNEAMPEDSAVADWVELFSGRLRHGLIEDIHVLTADTRGAIQRRCADTLSGAAFYHDIWVPGLDTGESFHWIDSLWRGDNEALCLTKRPLSVGPNGEPLHPGLVESAFQLLNSCWKYDNAELRRQGEIYVPFSIDRYYYSGQPVDDELWVHAQLLGHDDADSDSFTARVRMYSSTGDLVVAIDGFESRKISRARVEQLLRADERLPLHTIDWRPAAITSVETTTSATVIAVGPTSAQLAQTGRELAIRNIKMIPVVPQADMPLRDAIARALAAITDDGNFLGVVDLRAVLSPRISGPVDDGATLCAGMVEAVNAVDSHAPARTRLWWITAGTQAVRDGADVTDTVGAMVWGAASAVRAERPELRCTTIDMDPDRFDFDELAAELRAGTDELRVSFRAHGRHVARLQVSAANDPTPAEVQRDRAYLITGGLRGLGLRAAQMLASCGAGRIILIGRSRPTSDTLVAIRSMEDSGCVIDILDVDITEPNASDVIRNHLVSIGIPLSGIVHAAGVLDDATLVGLDHGRFVRVLAPKVSGMRMLESLTDSTTLDFLICFSSIAATLNGAGQANYAAANAFLDAEAHRLRAVGTKCTSIQWGPWGEIGMASRLTASERNRIHDQGLVEIRPETGMQTLAGLLHAGTAAVVAALVDWRRYHRANPAHDPLLTNMRSITAHRSTDQAPHRAAVLDALPGERLRVLTGLVEDNVKQALGFGDDVLLDRYTGFVDQGFDSLGLIDLRTRLQGMFGVRLPATFGFDYPTIDAAAHHLLTFFEQPQQSGTEHTPEPPAATTPRPEMTVDVGDLLQEELTLLEDMLSAEPRDS